MYVGRFLVVGPEVGAYRVSSRSFPNRKIIERDDRLTVVPTAEAEGTENPYVSYNCVRFLSGDDPAVAPETAGAAVLGNGSHVDPVAEKLGLDYPARDALAETLLALDYEKDEYDTPRIASVVDDAGAAVGIVRRDALLIERVEEPTLVATYEHDQPEPIEFAATSATEAAREAYNHEFEHAVCAAGVARGDEGFETGIENGED